MIPLLTLDQKRSLLSQTEVNNAETTKKEIFQVVTDVDKALQKGCVDSKLLKKLRTGLVSSPRSFIYEVIAYGTIAILANGVQFMYVYFLYSFQSPSSG